MLDASTTYIIDTLGYDAFVFPHARKLRSGAPAIEGQGLGAFIATGRSILRADSVACIGADILDGAYSLRSSLTRLKSLYGAHLLSRPTRIFGSSWSQTPAPEVIAFLRKTPWLEVLARDPVSQARMQNDLERDIKLVADLAFLLKPKVTSPAVEQAIAWISAQKSSGATVMAINPSGLTTRKQKNESLDPLVSLVERWLGADPQRQASILPHDTRPGLVGDVMVAAQLTQALQAKYGDRVRELKQPFDVWDAKALAGAVDLVLTGRMHFAIGALGMGTPPVSIVSQGKFEGLMQHFGLQDSELLVAPETIDEAPAEDQLAKATRNHGALRLQIESKLGAITTLAQANFDGL